MASIGRQSPFRRQNSASPATVRGTTPTTSPTKAISNLSPTKVGSLSPEKSSPFVRRPSQISNAAERPASPLARPAGNLSINDGFVKREQVVMERAPISSTARQMPAVEDTFMTSRPSATLDGVSGRDQEPEEYLAESPSVKNPMNLNPRPIMQRSTTASSTSTIKPPIFTAHSVPAATKLSSVGGSAYNHIPQPLLHSMRESFEVLDSGNSGAITSASVADMLTQLGLDNNPAALKGFFPPNLPAQLNLARYLDMLSSPLAGLTHPEELRAAFEAFDVEDSGQIDVDMLREALLHSGEGMTRMSEREVDSVLGDFAGRRAFGGKGLYAGKSKGDVFRYRDFMTNVSGGGMAAPEPEAGVVA